MIIFSIPPTHTLITFYYVHWSRTSGHRVLHHRVQHSLPKPTLLSQCHFSTEKRTRHRKPSTGTYLVGTTTACRSYSGSQDVLRKHHSDDPQPDTYSTKLARMGQVRWAEVGKTEKATKWNSSSVEFKRQMDVSARPNHIFNHSGKCTAARDLNLDMWLYNSVLQLWGFLSKWLRFSTSTFRCFARDDSFITSRNIVLIIKRSQFIIILSVISLPYHFFLTFGFF